MALTRPLLLLSAALLAASCGGDGAKPKKGGKKALTAEACPTLPLGAYTYGPDKTPTVPTPEGGWAAAAMPLKRQGPDTGDMSIIYGAAQMGYYMMGVQRPTTCKKGKTPCMPFEYIYDPRTDGPGKGESIHRQVVATFAQAWLHKVTGRPEFGASAEAALQMLIPHLKGAEGGPRVLRDLGGTGLLAMSLTEHARNTGDKSRDPVIADVGAYILEQIAEDGSFKTGSALVWIQMHNALWRLWSYTQDQKYMDALLKVARYANDHKNDRGKDQYFEHLYIYGLWAIEPMAELYKLRPEESWIPALVYEAADDVVKAQYTLEDAKECAWVGGFKPNNGKGHPNWNHTLKLETMADAYRFASWNGDAARAERYKASVKAGAEFLLRFQHRAGEGAGFPDPDQLVGGVPLFGNDPSVRIDIPGHGSIALLKSAVYLGEETAPGIQAAPPADPAAPPAADAAAPSGGTPGAAP